MSIKDLQPRSQIFRPALTFLMLLIGAIVSIASSTPPPPNIIFVLADDLGYMDINAYAERVTGASPAQQFYETPNLDRLTRKSLAFSQAYACQLCSPTRAGLLTGRNASKIGFTTAAAGTVKTYYN